MKKAFVTLSLLCLPTLAYAGFTDRDCVSSGNAYAAALDGFCTGSTVTEVKEAIDRYNLPSTLPQIVASAAQSAAEKDKCNRSSFDNVVDFSQQCVNSFAAK